MRPRIFPEQIQQLPPPINHVISFKNYKIDYSQFLGDGDFGKVYALIPRPENEKNVFSNWMPYIYDRIYPAKSNGENEYCIKISYFFIDSVMKDRPAIAGFWEKRIQNESAILRNQYGVSRINIYSTNSWYSQIKSRVNGYTLSHYIKTGELLDKKNYLMRKAFIDFLWAIASTPLKFNDLHPGNLMYDSKHHQWEIVDGSTKKELGYHTLKERVAVISNIKSSLFLGTSASEILLDILISKAIEMVSQNEFGNCTNYDEFIDRKCLLQAMNELKIPKEFHFLTTIKKADAKPECSEIKKPSLYKHH